MDHRIRGLGSDIIEVERIAAAMRRHGDRFLQRHFTPEEIQYCISYRDPSERVAGRFAAKEAVAKALGTGFQQGVTWLDIAIINDAQGKPEVFLSDKLQELVGPVHCLVTISHCKLYATATAILLAR